MPLDTYINKDLKNAKKKGKSTNAHWFGLTIIQNMALINLTKSFIFMKWKENPEGGQSS